MADLITEVTQKWPHQINSGDCLFLLITTPRAEVYVGTVYGWRSWGQQLPIVANFWVALRAPVQPLSSLNRIWQINFLC